MCDANMYSCVHACIYINMYIYVYVYICIYMYIYVYIYEYRDIHQNVSCKYTFIWMYTHIHMYIYIYICIHIYIYTQRSHAACICTHICMYMYIYIFSIYWSKEHPPPGGFPIYYVPSSRTVSKRNPLEAPGTNFSRGVFLLTVLDEGT